MKIPVAKGIYNSFNPVIMNFWFQRKCTK